MGWDWVSGTATGPILDASWLAVFMDASLFTVPGAILLSLLQIALSGEARSDRSVDIALLAFGAVAGAAILGGLGLREAPLAFAVLGGFYGLSTATVFVLLKRSLGLARA